MELSETLKTLRLEANLTQYQLARKINIGQSTIVGYEKGEREATLTNLIRYADFFNVSIDFLVGRENDFGNIVIKKEAPQLSAEELEIIENYRKLNPSGKKLIKQTFETLTFNTKIQRKKYTGD